MKKYTEEDVERLNSEISLIEAEMRALSVMFKEKKNILVEKGRELHQARIKVFGKEEVLKMYRETLKRMDLNQV